MTGLFVFLETVLLYTYSDSKREEENIFKPNGVVPGYSRGFPGRVRGV